MDIMGFHQQNGGYKSYKTTWKMMVDLVICQSYGRHHSKINIRFWRGYTAHWKYVKMAPGHMVYFLLGLRIIAFLH
jgi:hypothetical protein